MTVRELMLRVIAQLNEEPDSLGEYRDMLLAYLNEAYLDLSRVYRPFLVEQIACDAQGCVPFARLMHVPTRVMAVRYLGIAVRWHLRDRETIVVPGSEGRMVTIQYRYAYDELTSDAQTPDVPRAYQMAMADYATYRMLGNGSKPRQQRGDLFYTRYLNARIQNAPNLGDEDSLRIRGKYGEAGERP